MKNNPFQQKWRDAQTEVRAQQHFKNEQRIAALLHYLHEELKRARQKNIGLEKARDRRDRLANTALIAVTLAIFVLGVGAALLWYETHNQTAAADKAAAQQLRLMQRQLDEMKQSNRPWIGVNKVNFKVTTDEHGKPVVNAAIEMINAGKTPAKIISTRSSLQFLKKFKNPPDYGAPSAPAPSGFSSVVVPNGIFSDYVATMPGIVNDAGLSAMKNQEVGLYYFGEVAYADIAALAGQHVLHYCYVYFTPSLIANCPGYNEAN